MPQGGLIAKKHLSDVDGRRYNRCIVSDHMWIIFMLLLVIAPEIPALFE